MRLQKINQMKKLKVKKKKIDIMVNREDLIYETNVFYEGIEMVLNSF